MEKECVERFALLLPQQKNNNKKTNRNNPIGRPAFRVNGRSDLAPLQGCFYVSVQVSLELYSMGVSKIMPNHRALAAKGENEI